MARTMVVPKGFNRVERLSSYNHNVYFNGTIYIREQCDDDTTFYYTRVDAEDNEIHYIGCENFSIFDSDSDVVFLDDYFC